MRYIKNDINTLGMMQMTKLLKLKLKLKLRLRLEVEICNSLKTYYT